MSDPHYCERCGVVYTKMICVGENRKIEYGEWGHLSKEKFVEYWLCIACFKKELKKSG